jgi:superfamily II DNA/RNA helicase
MENFSELNLNPELLEAVAKLGYTKPTEIQAKAIPHLMTGGDLLGQSATGSGKTAAYLLPALHAVMQTRGLCLVLVPTRELALQVEEFAKKVVPPQFKMATIIGGGSMRHQQRDLSQKPNLIISTPGRLFDHIQRQTARLDAVSILVLDEGDRMLDFGFYPQIQQIVRRIPKKRQTILLSATFDKEVKKLAQEFLHNPVEIVAGDKHSAPVTIAQEMIETTGEGKNELLVDELNARKGSVLIFTKTKHRSDRLTRFLNQYGFKVSRIHGGRTLSQRKQAIASFKTGDSRILVATDIAARGLDIAQVAHVINFDLPMQTEDYLHRVGRTGRAGASGHALSFVTPAEKRQWLRILKFSGSQDSNKASGNGGPLSNHDRDDDGGDRPRSQRSSRPARPQRSFDRGDQRPEKPFQSRGPRRDDDRPQRSFDRPQKPFQARSPRRDDDRPARTEGFEAFAREERSERPQRSFNGRPQRRPADRTPRSEGRRFGGYGHKPQDDAPRSEISGYQGKNHDGRPSRGGPRRDDDRPASIGGERSFGSRPGQKPRSRNEQPRQRWS